MSIGGGQSTVGAGRSGAKHERRILSLDSPGFFFLIGLFLLLVAPLGALACLVCMAAVIIRRVRPSRVALAAVVLTVLGLAVHGLNPFAAIAAHAQGVVALWGGIGLVSLAQWLLDTGAGLLSPVIGPISAPALPTPDQSVTAAIAMTAPLGMPLGAWCGYVYAAWMSYRRRALAEVEGVGDWSRPEGVLDRLRATRTRKSIAAGVHIYPDTLKRCGWVAVGLGAYGKPALINTDSLLRPVLVLGGPRSGKTRHSMNMLAQLCSLKHPARAVPGSERDGPRSGVAVVDYKDDTEVAEHWAEFAHEHNRRFLHVKLANADGSPYRPPHSSAPEQSAFYDPLRRGNSTTKTDMLVNSVGREGDAAAYFRASYEVAQIAYEVASLTGYDQDKGGFQVLEHLMDMENLQRVADTAGKDGRGALADRPRLQKRVETLVAEAKKKDVTRGGVDDLVRLLSTYSNGSATGQMLSPGPAERTVDLRRAVHEGDVVVFSLSVQDYGELARTIGTLVLLDLQNTIAELRTELAGSTSDKQRQPRRGWRSGRQQANRAPWAPFYVQVEEFGSASGDAVLGVLNKGGDVEVRPFLSTQSWHDLVAVDGTGVFAHRVLDQVGNVFCFNINNGESADLLSELTPEVSKRYARDRKEYSAGLFGLGLRAANTGGMDVRTETERQVPPGAFQNLTFDRDQGIYEFIWITTSPHTAATHTHPAGPNRWYEPLRSVIVPPGVGTVTTSEKTWHPPTPWGSAERAEEQSSNTGREEPTAPVADQADLSEPPPPAVDTRDAWTEEITSPISNDPELSTPASAMPGHHPAREQHSPAGTSPVWQPPAWNCHGSRADAKTDPRSDCEDDPGAVTVNNQETHPSQNPPQPPAGHPSSTQHNNSSDLLDGFEEFR